MAWRPPVPRGLRPQAWMRQRPRAAARVRTKPGAAVLVVAAAAPPRQSQSASLSQRPRQVAGGRQGSARTFHMERCTDMRARGINAVAWNWLSSPPRRDLRSRASAASRSPAASTVSRVRNWPHRSHLPSRGARRPRLVAAPRPDACARSCAAASARFRMGIGWRPCLHATLHLKPTEIAAPRAPIRDNGEAIV